MNVYDFITNEAQCTLKSDSRLRNKRNAFEFILETYSDLFLKEFDKLTSTEDSIYLNSKLKEHIGLKDFFNEFLKIIKNDRDSLIIYLNSLLKVYEFFVCGKHQAAVELLYDILEKNELLDRANTGLLGSFFRGRKIEKNNDFLLDSFYYHIPFNERYKIKNQRFSFTGIPLHYAGASMLSTLLELRANGLDDKSFGISMFSFDHFATLYNHRDGDPVKSKARIYDISNSLYETINDLFYDAIENGKTVDSSLIKNKTTPGTINREFKKFILSQLCTFPKQMENTSFVEEYVLPQIFTEAIRMHKYDGIIYPSTLFNNKKINSGEDWNSCVYKNNIVMFSDYSNKLTHDRELYANFKVCVLDLTDVYLHDSAQIFNKLKKAINSLKNWLYDNIEYSPTRNAIDSMLKNIGKKLRIYEKLTIDDKPYLSYYAGKVELIYLDTYFKLIRKRVLETYKTEFEQSKKDN